MANPFTDSANQIGATGVGLADLWKQIVGQSESEALARIQQLGLAPPETLGQGSQQGADILSALNAQIPGQALGQTGSAWDQFMAAAPGHIQAITGFEGQLQQQQLANNAQMNSMSQQAAAAGGSGGSSEGLTPYQYFQVQADMADRAYRQEQDALDREFEMAKFEMGEEEKAQEDQAFAGIMAWVLQDAGFSAKEIKNLLPALVGTGATGLGAISGIAGDKKDEAADAADAAATAAGDRRDRRQDLRGDIAGFDVSGLPSGLSKPQVVDQIMADIQIAYPSLAGMKENRVRSLVNRRVNSQWPAYQSETRPNPSDRDSGNASRNWSGVGKLMNSYWDDIKDVTQTISVPDPNSLEAGATIQKEVKKTISYKTAFSRMYGRIADEYKRPNGKWKSGLNEKKVRARVHTFLRRQGLKRPPRRNPPQPVPPTSPNTWQNNPYARR